MAPGKDGAGLLGRRGPVNRLASALPPVRRVLSSLRHLPPERPADGQWERFVFFSGHGRSGSTLIAALLSLHPAVVISQEADALRLLHNRVPRSLLFKVLLGRHAWFHESRGGTWWGYRYESGGESRPSEARVLGDKMASSTSLRIADRPGLLDRLDAVVGLPLLAIVPVRNPYDVVSTYARRSGAELAVGIDRFERAWQGTEILRAWSRDRHAVVPVRFEDLKADPVTALAPVWQALSLDAAPLEQAIVDAVDPTPSRTREEAEWPDSDRARLAAIIDRHEWLAGYRFEVA